uniref:Uncharacterized protein n=1 Tax=Chromera velia CCMP2878 TaxID=1169474 RepID=A0A0G4GFI0_9ALVE|eukprot:Cvel_4637.t1-p1 / transcript=Cvel_4637.t1 / gene=Cvel_4637 / organism=Chromera_velia_CCMP2878 / gene_product=hypothetical protein / transcript_product=hypothetical protein / location=Cvel_scaffold204:112096-112534(-) / protein_length=99 / sequence_SO=supercontig / SO=protein_coding / is_pseudo=false
MERSAYKKVSILARYSRIASPPYYILSSAPRRRCLSILSGILFERRRGKRSNPAPSAYPCDLDQEYGEGPEGEKRLDFYGEGDESDHDCWVSLFLQLDE